MEVVVEYDYVAQEQDELNLKKGEVITNVVKIQEGWCQGLLNGRKGMFPDNFVKELKKLDKPKEQLTKKPVHSPVEDIRAKLSNVISNPPPSLPSHVQKKPLKQAKVLFDYEPQNSDELALEIGQIVDIINEVEPGWWEGSLNGKIGMLPSNFVELYIPPQDAQTGETKSSVAAAELEEVPEIKGRKVTGVGFGPNILGKGEIVLKPTNRGFPPTTVAIATASKNVHASEPITSVASKKKPAPMPEKDIKPVQKAKVLYAYKAENPDELNLQVGDIVVVLDQAVEDVGWWKGELKGKIGVFPDNFVTLLPLEEHKPPVNKGKKPIEPPAQKPVYVLKSKNVGIKQHEQPESIKQGFVKQSLVNHNLKETNKDGMRSPVFNKVKNCENQDSLHGPPLVLSSSSNSSQHQGTSSPISSVSQKNIVTQSMMSDLQKEVTMLKEQLDRMKKDHEKNLLNLMGEIDEEKKTRFNMQVEIDRLKKLLSSFSTLDHSKAL